MKDEEGHSLLSGASEKEDTQGAAPSIEQPPKLKKSHVEGSLDGQVGSAEEALEMETEEDSAAADGPWLPYIKPNMTISMVEMFETHNLKSLPPHMDTKLQISHGSERYYPLIYFNEFWTLKVCARPQVPSCSFTVCMHVWGQ